MKSKKNTEKKKKGAFTESKKDIEDIIDDIAYLDERGNIRKSKSYLDSIYLLNE